MKENISEGKKLPNGSDITFFLPSHYSYLNETYVKKWADFGIYGCLIRQKKNCIYICMHWTPRPCWSQPLGQYTAINWQDSYSPFCLNRYSGLGDLPLHEY